MAVNPLAAAEQVQDNANIYLFVKYMYHVYNHIKQSAHHYPLICIMFPSKLTHYKG